MRELRIAAVGDVHLDERPQRGATANASTTSSERADVLLLAGDLTRHGTPEEGAGGGGRVP